ncbi:kynB [Acrasis kona]|uniref:KynB n=1 Tax=Acrasis kona TaxID=1008807 RepID=A0AAW2Z3M6_9EUKA
MDEQLQEKLKVLRALEEKDECCVKLKNKTDLTVNVSSQGASFPYHDYTPYCQELNRDQILKELGVSDEHAQRNAIMNTSCDVSSSKDGVCVVTRTVLLSNSHAGTHCDQPAHFVKDPSVRWFDDIQYNGKCYIADLSNVKDDSTYIKQSELKTAIDGLNANLVNITRLLVRTNRTNWNKWEESFCHFDKDVASWLCNYLPNLALIAIDSPSVDNPNKAPIINYAHGQFWAHRVAIMENITFERMKHSYNHGYLFTVWSQIQEHDDSRGCQVFFFGEDS